MIGGKLLDHTDKKILNLLQQDGRADVKQIAFKVHKSPPAAHERIRKLQEQGYIKRYIAVLDRRLVGRPTLMVTLVKLNCHSNVVLREFAAYMQAIPEVEVCMHLSGEFDFLIQINVRDAMEYEQFLDTQLCALPVVEKVQSSLVLKEVKNYSPCSLFTDEVKKPEKAKQQS